MADPTTFIVIDEADRLSITSLEQVRSVFDQGGLGLILIGMPGIEKNGALPAAVLSHWFCPRVSPACRSRGAEVT